MKIYEFCLGQGKLSMKSGKNLIYKKEKGDWLIDAANLQVPDVRRLLREAKVP